MSGLHYWKNLISPHQRQEHHPRRQPSHRLFHRGLRHRRISKNSRSTRNLPSRQPRFPRSPWMLRPRLLRFRSKKSRRLPSRKRSQLRNLRPSPSRLNLNLKWSKSMNSCSNRKTSSQLTIRSLRRLLLFLIRRKRLAKTNLPRPPRRMADLNPINSLPIWPRKSISSVWIRSLRLSLTQSLGRLLLPFRNRQSRLRLPRNPGRSRKCLKSFARSSVRWAPRTRTSRRTTTSESPSVRWASSKKPLVSFKKLPRPAIAAAPSATPCSAARCWVWLSWKKDNPLSQQSGMSVL